MKQGGHKTALFLSTALQWSALTSNLVVGSAAEQLQAQHPLLLLFDS